MIKIDSNYICKILNEELRTNKDLKVNNMCHLVNFGMLHIINKVLENAGMPWIKCVRQGNKVKSFCLVGDYEGSADDV